MKHTLMGAGLLLLGTACASAPRDGAQGADAGGTTAAATPTSTPAPAAADGADSSVIARLERGACRGFCPEYRVEVLADGRVRFTGTRNVAASGAQESRVTREAAGALAESFRASGFASADSVYEMGSAGCGTYYADLPVAVLGAHTGAAFKTVRHDPGCQGAPKYLRALAARVDSVAGTAKWISKDSTTETGR